MWKNAVIVGAVCATLEGLLVFVAEPAVHPWVFVQSVLFWFGCGLIVFLAHSGLPPMAHGILLTVLLNVPWYIALAVVPRKLTMLPPLLVASIVLGAIIGALKARPPLQ